MVEVGLTVIDAVVAPVLQRNEFPPDAVKVDEPPIQNEESVEVMLHTGGVVSWVTVTSAKQLSDELNGFVIVKRYVPACVIRMESKPLIESLMPAPSCTLFLVHISIAFGKSVLYDASKYCDDKVQFILTGG